MLTIVLTDPVIVEAGKEALRTLNARKAAAEKAAAERRGWRPGLRPGGDRQPRSAAAAGGAAAAQAGDLAAATEGSAAEASVAEGPAAEAEHVDLRRPPP